MLECGWAFIESLSMGKSCSYIPDCRRHHWHSPPFILYWTEQSQLRIIGHAALSNLILQRSCGMHLACVSPPFLNSSVGKPSAQDVLLSSTGQSQFELHPNWLTKRHSFVVDSEYEVTITNCSNFTTKFNCLENPSLYKPSIIRASTTKLPHSCLYEYAPDFPKDVIKKL